MNSDQIKKEQDKLNQFLNSDDIIFSFKLTCDFPDRIKTIYSIIFPGSKRFYFYVRFFFARLAQLIDYSPIKVVIYKMIGMRIGRGVFIASEVMLDPHFPELIEIKDYAIIGWGTKLFTHEYADNTYRIGKIVIGEGAMIGAFSTIRGGVMIGNNAEVPYNSIVIRDIKPGASIKSVLRRQIINRSNIDSL